MSSDKQSNSVNANQQVGNRRPAPSPNTPEDFKNDPQDPNNPNEVIEEFNEKVRPTPL